MGATVARDTFYNVMKPVLEHEGGFTTDPDDAGNWSSGKVRQGKILGTKYGVTGKTLAGYRGRAVTQDDVAALTIDEAIEIFRSQYWTPIKGDDLPRGLDYAMLDFAINSGPAKAASTHQKVVGVTPDGIIGAKTLDAIRRRGDVSGQIRALCKARLAYMRTLGAKWRKYGKGWTIRVNEVQARALKMVQGVDLAALDPVISTSAPSADPRDRTLRSTTSGKANATTMVGVLGAGASEMAGQLSPYTDTLMVVQYLFIGLTLIGAGAALYATFRRIQLGEDA